MERAPAISHRSRWLAAGRAIALLSLIALPGCGSDREGNDLVQVCGRLRAESTLPVDASAAAREREAGRSWSDEEARWYYVCEAVAIGAKDERWRAEGRSPEERARMAFAARRSARMTARAMMSDRSSVEELRQRDRRRYGNPDGPTFDFLLAEAEASGLDGDARFEHIVESAQRTNPETDRRFGIQR